MGLFINDGLIFVLTLYLGYAGILTSVETGIFIGVLGVVMFISAPISGKLADKFDSRKLAIIGSAIMVVSTLIILFKQFIPIRLFLIFTVILLIGYSVFDTPNKKLY